MIGLGVGFLCFPHRARVLASKHPYATRSPIAQLQAPAQNLPGGIEVEGFAWPLNGLYPTLSGQPAVYLEFRLEREVTEERGTKWVNVFERIAADPFYVVDHTGATLIHPEEALLDVEDWMTRPWRQLEPEQKDRLLQGLLEGAMIPDFPPGEMTMTGPFQPRFRIYEKAIYIGSPLQVSGKFRAVHPGPQGLDTPELESYLAKVKSPTGTLKNLESVLLAHRGGTKTVREAREESIALAQKTALAPGPRSPKQTLLYGHFENAPQQRLTITDLHENSLGPEARSQSARVLTLSAGLLAFGLFLGFEDATFRNQFGLPAGNTVTQTEHASSRPQVSRTTEKRSMATPPPNIAPLPTFSGGLRVSSSEMEKWVTSPGSHRWVLKLESSLVLVRPPSLKPELIIPHSPLHPAERTPLVANRWIGTYGARNEQGLIDFSIWDLEKARVIHRVIEKHLVHAAILGSQAEMSAVITQSAENGFGFKIVENASGKVLVDQNMKAMVFKKALVSPQMDRILLIAQDGAMNPVASTWQVGQVALQNAQIGLMKDADQKFVFSEDGKWLAVSRGDTVILSDVNDWKMKYTLKVPGVTQTLEPLTFTADDRLLLLHDGQKILVYSNLSQSPILSQLAPLEKGTEILAISRDGQKALLRNGAQDRLILRPFFEASKQKYLCKSNCLKNVPRDQMADPSFSIDSKWFFVGLPVVKENAFWDLDTDQSFVLDYDLPKALKDWQDDAPTSSLSDCLTFSSGCLRAGQKALKAQDSRRAYGYLYGACRAGLFDACVEISKAATVLQITAQQAESFAEFGCRFGHSPSCAAKSSAPSAAPPAEN